MNAQMLTITESAANRVKTLVAKSDAPVLGLRIGVNQRGCSGMSYTIDYAREQKPFDEVVENNGVRLFIDPAAIMFLIGSEIDYEEDKLQSGFVFRNPNEKGRCGCGESFHV